MSEDGDSICVVCTEEMDLTDQQLKACKCGCELCVWCWHEIMNRADKDKALCPACRAPYNKETILGRTVATAGRKENSRNAKSKTSAEAREHLSSVGKSKTSAEANKSRTPVGSISCAQTSNKQKGKSLATASRQVSGPRKSGVKRDCSTTVSNVPVAAASNIPEERRRAVHISEAQCAEPAAASSADAGDEWSFLGLWSLPASSSGCLGNL